MYIKLFIYEPIKTNSVDEYRVQSENNKAQTRKIKHLTKSETILINYLLKLGLIVLNVRLY